jgi:glyoxylase-like metal-dependent hydrolase (beta-lactamase superfamily II)
MVRTPGTGIRQCSVMAVCALALLGGVTFASVSHAKPAHVARLRLYVMDCGTIVAMDPALYGLKAEEIHGDTAFVTPCYLVVHPKGTLVWDVGQVPDKDIPDDGTLVQQTVLRATRRLSTQLMAIGYEPQDITYIAMSHYHADHTANANAFAKSTWIVQQTDYDMMFKPGDIAIRVPETYQDLKTSKRITLQNQDHDVFGDGTVVIKTAPGHTPGHQMLFLKLAKFDPLLLAGDLYHLPEEKTLDRVPTFDFDSAMTRATRKRVDEFLSSAHATMWIQHNPATYATLKKAPDYYE